MKNIQKGFTLIELMIVVAIIGILAAVAIPAYQDYITRAQVAEAAELMAGFKTPVAEFFGDKGHWPTTLGATGSGASVEGTITGKYSSIGTSPTGAGTTGTFAMVATMTQGRADTLDLALATDDAAGWACGQTTTGGSAAAITEANGSTTVDEKWLPAGCKP